MTATQRIAFALADALMADAPGGRPFRAVAFVLSVAAHRRAGVAHPEELHRRVQLLTKALNKALRNEKHLEYDPLDVIEFESLSDLLTKRPKTGTVWQDICVITHAGGELPRGVTQQIFLGDDEPFDVSEDGGALLDAINARPRAVERFRNGFDKSSQITLLGCGVGSNGPSVPVFVRQLFGTDGLIKYPVKNVDLFPSGFPGTPKDPDSPSDLRPLVDGDWQVTPSKDAMLNAVDPPLSTDFFRD